MQARHHVRVKHEDCPAGKIRSLACGGPRGIAHPRKVLLLQPSCSMNAAPPAVSTAMRSMVVAVQFCSTTPSATASPRRATCACAARQTHVITRWTLVPMQGHGRNLKRYPEVVAQGQVLQPWRQIRARMVHQAPSLAGLLSERYC